jgi:FixJ family two-component response regulator
MVKRKRASAVARGTSRMAARALVVVVDDDPSVRKALRRVLRSAEYEVEVCASAAEALASRRLEEAACVVLDIRMPGISGLDLQQRLASRHPRLPVVVITAHADEETRRRALEGGAVAVLYKPFDDEALLAEIARAIERRARS